MNKPLWTAALLCICAAQIAACQPAALSPQPTENTIFNVGSAVPDASDSGEPRSNNINGTVGAVTVSIVNPDGWTTVVHDDSLALMQHDPSLATGVSSPDSGIIITLFMPNPEDMQVPPAPSDEHNHALWMLRHVVEMPSIIGLNAVASAPVAFDWNGHPAAYYLLTGQMDKRAIVLAVSLIDGPLTGINISMPEAHLADAHSLLGEVFADFTVDGVMLGGDALNVLPNPLVFPVSGAAGTIQALIGG